MKLPTATYGALEIALNRYIAQDPAAQQRVLKLLDKTLQIELTDLNITLVFVGTQHGFQLMPAADGVPDVRLTGTSRSLSKIITDKEDGLASAGLRIEGDVGVAQQFTKLFASIDFDLGDWLDSHLGPVPAYFLENGLRGLGSIARRAGDLFVHNTAEYFREETRDVVGVREHDYFASEVDHLKRAGQALFNRLETLKAKD